MEFPATHQSGPDSALQMMYRSKPCLPFFSSIAKNVASPNLEIKKLVYIYILRYAEAEPDLSLLSINYIQKSLTDQNPQIRTLALKVMSGIRVPAISQIVVLAIKRGCGDMSPYVRKAAALAIPKCYRLDPNTLSQLLDYLSILLGDKQYFVAGSAVAAFLDVCPQRIDLIHRHYRSLVRKLVDMDEWGQLATLNVMTYYSRKCFPRRVKKHSKAKNEGFYEEDGGNEGDGGSEQLVQELDPDLEILLKACKNLLQSRNSAVIIAVARCFLYLATPEYIDLAVGPLVALMRSPQDVRQVAMYNIVSVCLVRPASFVKYLTHFLVHATDPIEISRLKFEILTLLFPLCKPHMKELILSELAHFTRSSDERIVRECVRAIGRCVQNDTKASTRCLRLLLQQISSQDGNLAAESLTVIRHLIQQDPEAHVKTVIRLAKNLDATSDPQARASIIWLVGEFSGIDDEDNIAPDVLRILAKGFADEPEAAKLQILLLAAKVYLHYLNRTISHHDQNKPLEQPAASPTLESSNPFATDYTIEGAFDSTDELQQSVSSPLSASGFDPNHPIPLLYKYILLLTRYDTSYDLRDRARTYTALLSTPQSTQLASLLLLAPKPVPHTPSPSESRKNLLLGSSSLVIGGAFVGAGAGDEPLPEWVKDGEEPDPELRNEALGKEENAVVMGRNLPAIDRLGGAGIADKGKGKEKVEKSFEDWLAEKDKEEEESEVDESDEEYETDSEEEEDEEVDEEEEEEQEEEEDDDEEESEGESDPLVRS